MSIAIMACVKPSKKYPNGRTGTRAGYMAHYYLKETACKDCVRGHAAEQAMKRVTHPEVVLQSNLWYKYRMTLKQYREMLSAQGGCCAICRVSTPTDIRTDRFHVDHDHRCCPGKRSCGKCNRGLLCHACNTALGNFHDDPELLERAAAYIRSRRKE